MFQVFSPGLTLVFVTVVGLAHSRVLQRRQISDGYGAPAGPVITAGPSQTRPSYNGGASGPRPSQPKPSYNAPGGGGGKFNFGLPSLPKPDLSGLFGKLKNPFGALKGGLKLPSLPGKPSGGYGRPKPTYGSSSPGIGLPSFPKPSLPSLPKPDLSGIKNIFSGIIAAKKVCVWKLCNCGTISKLRFSGTDWRHCWCQDSSPLPRHQPGQGHQGRNPQPWRWTSAGQGQSDRIQGSFPRQPGRVSEGRKWRKWR